MDAGADEIPHRSDPQMEQFEETAIRVIAWLPLLIFDTIPTAIRRRLAR